MHSKKVYSKYGLIGENLTPKQNIEIEISSGGIISNIKWWNNFNLRQKMEIEIIYIFFYITQFF